MGHKTPLYDEHLTMNAKVVDFHGWEMPIHYGSQIEEHHKVRTEAGMFDVSHMTIIDLHGPHTRELLRRLVANNVDRLRAPGKALYTCMLNGAGGVIDDLIVYLMNETWFRLVVNAATRDKDLAWISQHAAQCAVEVHERRDLAMIAVQGPKARERVHIAMPDIAATSGLLTPFNAARAGETFVARTGYTGEDGYEIILPAEDVPAVWRGLYDLGVAPVGLGARDTLRLEAGLNLYGQDMDETTTPLESGLAWTVAWEPADRQFIGRGPLEQQRATGHKRHQIALVLQDKGVLRTHQTVLFEGRPAGEITSGSYSPTLGRSIAFARVDRPVGDRCNVDIRGHYAACKVVKAPFVRHGKVCVELT